MEKNSGQRTNQVFLFPVGWQLFLADFSSSRSQ
jgi:hypothetical protein